jgi:hypothetical protein
MTALPVMCGFFRMTAAMWTTREDRQITLDLMEFAERQNHRFGCVFAEDERFPRLGAWQNMINFCRDAAWHDVVIPTLADLDSSLTLATHIREDLAEEIDGTVWVVAEHTQEVSSWRHR